MKKKGSRQSELTSQREIDLMVPMLESLDPASAHELSGGRVEWIVKQPTSTSSLLPIMVIGFGLILLVLSLTVGVMSLSNKTLEISRGND